MSLIDNSRNISSADVVAHRSNPATDGTASYQIYAAAVTEVEVDVLTGEKNIRRVDVIEDTGASISPAVDIGQVEGGLVMSLGFWTSEELRHDPATGRLLTRDTWEYKPPSSQDIPEAMHTTFVDSGRNKSAAGGVGILGSKATGEPAFLLGVSAVFAIRHALAAAKADAGADPRAWFRMGRCENSITFRRFEHYAIVSDGPATHERIQTTGGVTSDQFRMI